MIKFINAFDEPYEGAKTLLNGKSRLEICSNFLCVGGGHPFMSGIISNKDKDGLQLIYMMENV